MLTPQDFRQLIITELRHDPCADARDEAYGETRLALETFPIAPPLTWEEAMEQPIYLDP
ncbi:hypothetical protein H6G52_06095 [Limnothrix sp. FACHB-881]|uniref:hypothetical protein n=1 Tax=Limnothrix sp. FACHB-881 TaxID=2692819 RepID=UPI001687CB9E|nr:hypothetical protein [Limnothrix sp. FACHB-881]MBD2634926.1 hypothetical protein [Limnothrix sp. FACHB-881]